MRSSIARARRLGLPCLPCLLLCHHASSGPPRPCCHAGSTTPPCARTPASSPLLTRRPSCRRCAASQPSWSCVSFNGARGSCSAPLRTDVAHMPCPAGGTFNAGAGRGARVLDQRVRRRASAPHATALLGPGAAASCSLCPLPTLPGTSRHASPLPLPDTTSSSCMRLRCWALARAHWAGCAGSTRSATRLVSAPGLGGLCEVGT